jgi:hypothetical protein
MTTICSFCGNEINEESDENKGKQFLICKCNHGLIPKGSNSYKDKEVKGGNEMAKKEEKEKKEVKEEKKEVVKEEKKPRVTRVGMIKELLDKKKNVEEISQIVSQAFAENYSPAKVRVTMTYLEKLNKK